MDMMRSLLRLVAVSTLRGSPIAFDHLLRSYFVRI